MARSRLGPTRRFTNAISFISKKMFMNAMGTVMQQDDGRGDDEAEDAHVGAERVQAAWTQERQQTADPQQHERHVERHEHRDSGRMILPARRQAAPGPRRRRSLVDAAHDRVEAGHDGHRVRHQVPGHQLADRLEGEVATGRGCAAGTAGRSRR